MKNRLLIYTVTIVFFTFNCFSQPTEINPIDKAIKNVDYKSTVVSNSIKTVKEYHVEENINMKFGGYVTTYTVSDTSLINTTDLGPNNIRVVTPRFEKAEHHIIQLEKADHHIIQPKELKATQLAPVLETTNLKTTDLPISNSVSEESKYAYIVKIKTDERVAEKGYKSVDIFQKLGNQFYYNGEYDKAARWYGELFSMTTDLKAEYFYRYSNTLKAIGEKDKAAEMLEKFTVLSKNIEKN